MLLTWYLISTSHILPSLVLFLYPDHSVVLVFCFHAFPTEINSLVYSVYLLTPALMHFLGFIFTTFRLLFSFSFLISYSHIQITQKTSKKLKTTILTKGRQQSPLFLTFSGAILGPLLFIFILLLLTPSPFHHSPNSLQLGYVSLLALYQVLEELPNSSVLLHKFLECLFNGIQNPTISEDYNQSVGISVGYILLLESNVPSTCERLAMKKKLLEKVIIIIIIITTHLEWYTRQFYMVLTYLSQGLAPLILTVVPLWYFSCCLLLVFLEGLCSFSSLAVTSLYLNPSAPFKRVVSSFSILSQSCWRYSNILFFFSFFSATLFLSTFFLVFVSTSLLAF